ncbi:S41 family peptidase [Chromobacterium sp. IIBBL 290-4]|uniref:S41 family peptidase n=1 Tax=Chromobacterium sp. IIBBL 290-4 TaxID=2953890 RepID=UPI0020B8ED8F|nr:S41 family peptidase [Chromobacterium sp. IIBBL 290-4]UTH73040.1 S41 family peptidase [Chromobacterium sp. IIBBL 290-4]
MNTETIFELISQLRHEIATRYVFPEVAESISSFLKSKLRDGGYAACDAPEDLAAAITDDLRRLSNDEHLRVRYFAEPHRPETEGDEVREQNDRQKHVEGMGFGIARIEFLDGNIGYLDIRELVELQRSAESISAAMTLLAKCEALIIDLRKCCGGDPATVAWLCSYLFKARTNLSALHLREAKALVQFHTHDWVPGQRFGEDKPVYLLQAHYTFSGAEMLAYDLQALGRAVVVGETSGGGAHACQFVWLTPHFSLLLPEARSINPITQTNWEKVGVKPDVDVGAEDALAVAAKLARDGMAQA